MLDNSQTKRNALFYLVQLVSYGFGANMFYRYLFPEPSACDRACDRACEILISFTACFSFGILFYIWESRLRKKIRLPLKK